MTIFLVKATILRTYVNAKTILQDIDIENPEVYIIDYKLPGDMGGIEVAIEILKKFPSACIMFITEYNYLLNEKNNEKTDGYLVIEIVPPDQNLKDIVLPDSGDRVHVWGAWVTDKPKGWHEIHPAWKVVKE